MKTLFTSISIWILFKVLLYAIMRDAKFDNPYWANYVIMVCCFIIGYNKTRTGKN